MCGRYTLYQTEEFRDRYKVDQQEVNELLDQLKKRYNISPSQILPTIRQDDKKQNHIDMMRWGYMPFWAKEPKDVFKYKTFNARSEGIFEKRTWKDAIISRRCLVPSTGFYEWKKTDTGKQPYFIRPKDQEVFSFAGIWGSWKDAEGLEWHTYSIITTTPNKDMTGIHDRMPVILHPDEEDLWLDLANDNPDDIAQLMRPYEDRKLEIYEVSRDVNTSRIDAETLVLPINSK